MENTRKEVKLYIVIQSVYLGSSFLIFFIFFPTFFFHITTSWMCTTLICCHIRGIILIIIIREFYFVFFVICLSPPYLHECVLSYSSPISHGGMHQLKLRRRKSDVPTCIDVQKNVSLIALLSTSFLFQFLSLSCVFN